MSDLQTLKAARDRLAGGMPGRPQRRNADGSISTELSITVPDPRAPGRWINIPSMYEGREVSEQDAAARIAAANYRDPETGREIRSFGSVNDAVQAARARSDALGTGQGGNPRLDALRAKQAELKAQMDADTAAHERAQAAGYYRGALGTPGSAPGGDPGSGPTAGTPGPVAAAQGDPLAPWARGLLDYTGETIGNIPESAERVASGIYEAVTNPGETLDAAGRLIVGTGQTINEAVGLPEWARIPGGDLGLGDQRATAAAAGQAIADRYGSPERAAITLRDDPAGFLLDATGLAGGVAGAARLPAVAGRLPGPGGVTNPVTPPRGPMMTPEDVRVATDAGDAVRETVQGVRDAATEAAKRERGKRAFIENAPTTEALHRQADAFFDAARRSGVRFSAREFGPFRKKLVRTLREEGADKVLHPKVDRLIGLIEDAPPGVAPDLGNLMILRRQFGAAASDIDKSTARLGSKGVDLIDDFVESGSASASGIMRQANRLWARMRKAEAIERAMLKAETAQQGLEAGLRAEFKSIYRGIVDGNRKYRGFTPEETAAIKAVATGNITANVLRRLASLSGGSGPQRAMQNLIQGSAVGGGLGFALGGPPGAALGAAAGPLVGHAAGRLATRGTQRRANLARAIAARGETPKQARKAPQNKTLAELFEEAAP